MQGTRRGYYAGFDGDGKAAILKHAGAEVIRLATADYPWTLDQAYDLTLEARGDRLTLLVDGKAVAEASDGDYAWGMVGYALYGSGRAELGDLTVEEM